MLLYYLTIFSLVAKYLVTENLIVPRTLGDIHQLRFLKNHPNKIGYLIHHNSH